MSHSFIDRSSNYFTQNYDNEETQKKIDPIAQLKEINNTTVREWGLFNNHPAQMFAKGENKDLIQRKGKHVNNNPELEKEANEMGIKASQVEITDELGTSSGIQKKDGQTFTVPEGWNLTKIAEHLKTTVEALKEANLDKLKTWGTIQGFNAGEIIVVPVNSEKEISADDKIKAYLLDYNDHKITMHELARALLPYTSSNSIQIIDLMDKLDMFEKDNLAYALASNSSDSELSAFDKKLLRKMSVALDTWFTWSRTENLKQKERVDKYLSDDKNVYNEEARNEAIEFVKDNKEAYLKGDERWEAGTRNNKNYNNILIVNKNEADENHLKVYRNFTAGVYTLIDTETLTEEKYTEEKALATLHNTYCNIAATKIGLSYGAPNIQNHGGTEHSANAMYDNFTNGFYNTETHEFKEVKFDEAETYANSGGLAYAVWKNSSGHGHIATLIGGYGGDGEKTMANLKIFQAGIDFGSMTYSSGFNEKESKFYVWKKK